MYELVCPDGRVSSLDDYENCNFGTVANDIVMTSSLRSDTTVMKYKDFLNQAIMWFGKSGSFPKNPANFTMFGGVVKTLSETFTQKNVMFNDATTNLHDVQNRDRYYTWIGELSDIYWKLYVFLRPKQND